MHDQIKIRPANADDLASMKSLFADTIREVCKKDYDQMQIDIWVSSVNDDERWSKLIMDQWVLLAELSTKVVGFVSLKDGVYLDMFYVHKDHQGLGIASKLLLALETEANQMGSTEISSDVSISAKNFFLKSGFKVQKEQQVVRKGIYFTNYKMIKNL